MATKCRIALSERDGDGRLVVVVGVMPYRGAWESHAKRSDLSRRPYQRCYPAQDRHPRAMECGISHDR